MSEANGQFRARFRCGMRPLPSLAMLTLALAACGRISSDRPSEVPEIQLISLTPITGEASPVQAGFGRIADIEIDDFGNIYVLDGLTRTVQGFDTQGAVVRVFGRQGQGPGELERPTGLAWGPDGTLWVVDPGSGRFTVFDATGELNATFQSPDPFFYPQVVGFSRAGNLSAAGPGFEGGALEDPMFFLIEWKVGNSELTRLRRIELPFIQQSSPFEVRRADMVAIQVIPFSSEPLLGFGSDARLFYAHTREPWVYRWSDTGGLEQTFGRDFPASPVTSAERSEVLEGKEMARFRRDAGPAAFAEFSSLIPATKPHLAGFFFNDDESLWIIRSGEEDPAENSRSMDVYDQSGALIATARAVLEWEPRPRIRNGLLVGVVRDDLSVETIARYQVQR